MSNDKRPSENEKNTAGGAAEPKTTSPPDDKDTDSSGIQTTSVNKDIHTGISGVFPRPIFDASEDSLARKVEDIRSSYDQIRHAEKLSISGITSLFGDIFDKSMKDPAEKDEQDTSNAAEAAENNISTDNTLSEKSDKTTTDK